MPPTVPPASNGGGPSATAQPCGPHAAEGAPRFEARGLEREALTSLGENGLELGERRARSHGDYQLGRLVAPRPRPLAQLERLAPGRFSVEGLGIAAADIEARPSRARVENPVSQAVGRRTTSGRQHQNLGSSGNGIIPRCTCILPYSAQRERVGITLPGFNISAGSKARFTAMNCSRSSGENCTHMELSFSTPTPCSPVTVPPSSRLASRISAPKSSQRLSWSRSLASNKMSGCRLPSPAWNTFTHCS